MFCTSCGNQISQSDRFCTHCGSSNLQSESPEQRKARVLRDLNSGNSSNNTQNIGSNYSHRTEYHYNRGAYQKLTLVGGILGIVLTPIVAISLGLLLAIGSAFSSSGLSAQLNANLVWVSISVSILVSIAGIICVFLIKTPKIAGIILLILGIIEMIGTLFVSGLLTWVLFIVSGILAIKAQNR